MMEMYSTALWHLHKEKDLSLLAHDLLQCDRYSPSTWCAAGNCVSLHKEHDVAIKFFERAVQVSASELS
jgi:anaphase-promoting complex subunit 3